MPLKIISNEVWIADEPVVQVSRETVLPLHENATRSDRRRARLCAHRSSEDLLHEMLIVLAQGSYVRPHRHPTKTESFHVIEGQASIILFEENGAAQRVIRLGDYRSGRTFYYRLNEPWFHTVLVESPVFVFHEVTNGPFDRADTIFAPWAPEETETVAAQRYREELERWIQEILSL